MTTDEAYYRWALADAIFWARYHARLSRNIYCDNTFEHEERAADFRSEARLWIRAIRLERKLIPKHRKAA
jgi:hypothetical protein